MAKGLCSEGKSWLGQIADLGGKIGSIFQKAKDAVKKMFKDPSISTALSDTHKAVRSEELRASIYEKEIHFRILAIGLQRIIWLNYLIIQIIHNINLIRVVKVRLKINFSFRKKFFS